MGGSVDFSCVRARYISGWPSFLPLICLGEIYPFGQGWRVFVSRRRRPSERILPSHSQSVSVRLILSCRSAIFHAAETKGKMARTP